VPWCCCCCQSKRLFKSKMSFFCWYLLVLICFIVLSLSQCRKMVLVISLTQVVWTLKHSDLMPNLRPGAKLTRFQSKMFWFDLIEINYSWFPRTPNQVTLCASTGGKLVCFSSAKGYVCLSFLLLLLTFRILLRVWGPTTKNLDMLTSQHCLHWLTCRCH
jgi:hypothetical protein